jgi:hypothetical protein
LLVVNKITVKHLDRDEFASALRKGQGRALLHVLHFGLDEVADLVLEACIHNQVYDQDFDCGRSDWLFSMFQDTVHFLDFRARILNSIKNETDLNNLFQLLRLAGCLAGLGDVEAYHTFEEVVYRLAADPKYDWLMVTRWLDVMGAEAMLQFSRIYGQRLLDNPKDIIDVGEFLYLYEGHPAFEELLKKYSKKENSIRIFQEYLEKQARSRIRKPENKETRKKRIHNKFRKKNSLQSILEEARNRKWDYPAHYYSFGKHATIEELEYIYTSLLCETDDAVRTRLLWVFRGAKLPHLDKKLFDWANGVNNDLRAASINALAQISDEQVHDLARMKTENQNLLGADNDVFNLFLNNYDKNDALLINRSLVDIRPDAQDAYSLGFSLNELANRYEDPNLAPTIVWTYENTPSTFNRYQTVKWLAHYHQLSDAYRFECKYDPEVFTREFVQSKPKYLSTSDCSA